MQITIHIDRDLQARMDALPAFDWARLAYRAFRDAVDEMESDWRAIMAEPRDPAAPPLNSGADVST